MKCPKCRYNHRYANGMTCSRCKYEFALDPKVRGFGDGRFLAMVRKASADGSRYFTANQLVTTFSCNQKDRLATRIASFVAILIFGAGFCGSLLQKEWTFVIITGVIVLFSVVGFLRSFRKCTKRKPKLVYSSIAGYTKKKGPIKHLVTEDRWLRHRPRNWQESDLYDYGAEGILIVEHDILVDLFVMNELHTETRLLIVSATGYPDYLVEHTNDILADQPHVPVFALHDATKKNDRFVERLKRNKFFRLAEKDIVDLGFSTDDVKSIHELKYFKDGSTLKVDAIPWKKLALIIPYAVAEKESINSAYASGDTFVSDHFG